jgi:hypothetical protein
MELSKDSDLKTGIYEGGLKIWECAIDLASHVASNVNVKDLHILELGCGAGLPGIVAGVKGASEIHFQVTCSLLFNFEALNEFEVSGL